MKIVSELLYKIKYQMLIWVVDDSLNILVSSVWIKLICVCSVERYTEADFLWDCLCPTASFQAANEMIQWHNKPLTQLKPIK